jgi:integrase
LITKHGHFNWLDVRIRGKRIRRSLKTVEHALAIERARDIKNELLEASARKDVKLRDFAKQYLDWAWSHKPASTDREQQRLDKILPFFENLGIQYSADITPYHLEQLRAWLREHTEPDKDGKEKNVRKSKTTINRDMQLLRGLFYKAINSEVYQGQNPLKKVRFFKETPHLKPLTDSQTERILEASLKISKKPRSSVQKVFHDLVIFVLNTGMRKSEILNLEWKDIRENEATVKGKGERVGTIPSKQPAQEILIRQQRRSSYVFDIPNRRQRDLFR